MSDGRSAGVVSSHAALSCILLKSNRILDQSGLFRIAAKLESGEASDTPHCGVHSRRIDLAEAKSQRCFLVEGVGLGIGPAKCVDLTATISSVGLHRDRKFENIHDSTQSLEVVVTWHTVLDATCHPLRVGGLNYMTATRLVRTQP